MNERIKIISDGNTTEVYQDGVLIEGLTSITFEHKVHDIAKLTTERYIKPAPKYPKVLQSIFDDIQKMDREKRQEEELQKEIGKVKEEGLKV